MTAEEEEEKSESASRRGSDEAEKKKGGRKKVTEGMGRKKENVYMSWFTQAAISKYHRLGDLTI